jgi:hypothetical protein
MAFHFEDSRQVDDRADALLCQLQLCFEKDIAVGVTPFAEERS